MTSDLNWGQTHFLHLAILCSLHLWQARVFHEGSWAPEFQKHQRSEERVSNETSDWRPANYSEDIPLRFMKLRGLNYPHERPLHAKGEVCTVYIFWVISRPLILGFIAKSFLWPLRFLKLMKNPCMPKIIISNSQNYLACKISCFFVY